MSPDGKLRGMRVYPGTNAQAFNRLGLRPGDLVTAINGTTLDDQTRERGDLQLAEQRRRGARHRDAQWQPAGAAPEPGRNGQRSRTAWQPGPRR